MTRTAAVCPHALPALPYADDALYPVILKIYPGGPHGITDTHQEQLKADLLEFISA